MHPEGTARRASWPYVEDKSYLWTWLFVVPLVAYTLWQVLYFLIVDVLRRQRLLRDPEVMTSYRYPFLLRPLKSISMVHLSFVVWLELFTQIYLLSSFVNYIFLHFTPN